MAEGRLPSWLTPVLVLVGSIVAAEAIYMAKNPGEILHLEIIAKALLEGCGPALFVTGIVLIYRAQRVVNFAHSAAAYLGVMLYLLLRVIQGWSFWVVVPMVILGAVLAGVLIDMVVVRRFANAPRLVLNVATIALAQCLVGIALLLPERFGLDLHDITRNPPPGTVPAVPLGSWKWHAGPQLFTGIDLLAVVTTIVLLGGLAYFFQRSDVGIAIRGAAENRPRAALLGIRVNDLSAIVWAIALGLAMVGALLQAASIGSNLPTALGSGASAALAGGGLLRGLAAAVVARMERMPVAIAAAFGISVLDRAVFLAFRDASLTNVVLLVVIVGGLLLQRRQYSRVAAGESGSWEAAEELKPIPSVLRPLPTVARGRRRFLILVAILLLAFPWIMSPAQTLNGSLFAIYGIVTVSLVVLTGWGGQISLGQFAFVAVGSVVGGSMTSSLHLPFPIAAVGAVVAGGVVAVIVGLPALRIQGLFLAVTTLGFAVVTQTVLLNDRWFDAIIPDRVTRPVFLGIDMNKDERGFYYLCLLALIAAVAVASALRTSRTGRVLIAMRDNDRAAQSYGVNLVRTRLVTFAIAGGLAGLAGLLYASHEYSVLPQAYGTDQSIFMFLMAVMGGLGSVYGVLLGTLYFGITRIVLAQTGGQLLASGFGVFAILLFFPGGLGAIAYRARDSWLRRIALRHRIFVPSLLGVDRRLGDEVTYIPIAPRPDVEPVSRRYTRKSEISTVGSSQRGATWQD